MAIYMKLGDIKGDVTTSEWKDQVELDSTSFGMDRAIDMTAGAVKNREQGTAMVQPISCSKMLDSSTPLLVQAAVDGANIPECKITIVRTGDKAKFVKVGEMTLTNVLVGNYNLSGGAGGRPMESFVLYYTKILFDFEGADAENKNGTPIKITYDLADPEAK
jgi:type VI secretion system secreted protein Hcp